MAYERPRHSNVVLNLTPLIDIVFLLLVFFMLTAHFIEDQALVVDLPDANSAPAAAEHKEIVTVILSPEGVIFVNDQPVHEHELQKFLKAALDETENRKQKTENRKQKTELFAYVVIMKQAWGQL
ncbi:hypothetical protein BOW39_10045 [Solemya velum gill symbiont]|nr:biopolymer transporter ExbD [Solemya velum gill symbiont]OOZ48513.1 hypothetical protein BOW39_10045 [Solemya velum gill symbiont]OOZ50743.1 hypothetical protein BOW40_09680 [Solemya velum gill symbiont]OOZ53599.1 hypothetical protein BOW41_09130 [Solemya velum gill symbiont]OOZ66085.1 hypothetical protein BOW46_09295 [Solemya velum gill symbiont]